VEPKRKKVWSGRFESAPDARSEAYTSSIGFDTRLVQEDIRGSVAHVRMLGAQGIIASDEATEIERGLWLVWDEAEVGTLELTLADEDVHSGVERRLRELIGPAQGRLHTARSRNDQVITDVRLWLKRSILRLTTGLIDLNATLLDLAELHVETIMPGFTHTQRAQPVTLGHHLLAYVSMFERDLERFQQAYARLDLSPLGSSALAGTTFPIDRAMVANDLGFAGITRNSLDAIGDRDPVLDTLYCNAMVVMHTSRLCEELVWWSSGEVKYLAFDDAFSTGSSIMPQKKNADVAELTRGKTGRVFGHLIGMLTVMKGLPLTYNSDMQEDKEALFDTVDTVVNVLGILPPALQTLTFNTERLADAAAADFSLATDAADLLARNGVPFREAHEIVGRLVRDCTERGCQFSDLSDEEWAEAHPIFGNERPPMTSAESVAARDVPGGTAPGRVRVALGAALERSSDLRAWQVGEDERMTRVMSRGSTGPE